MPTYTNDICPACENSNYKIIGKVDRSRSRIEPPRNSRIVCCKSCGMIYVNPMPHWLKEEFVLLYGSDYFDKPSPGWSNIRAKTNPERRYRLISKYLGAKNKTMLEVGAGVDALLCRYLADRGWDTTAQEPSESFRDELEEHDSRIKFISDPFLELADKTLFSVIFADSVFEHVANPDDYFKKSYDLLEPGGLLYFVSPNEHGVSTRIKTWMNRSSTGIAGALCPYNDACHLLGFSRKSVDILCQKAGLRLMRFIKRYDWRWFHDLENIHDPTKYPRAALRYVIDSLGYGRNIEVVIRKEV